MTPDVVPAQQVFTGPPPVLDGVRLLAEGDSWFTLGTLNLAAATNLLLELRLERPTTVLSCAYPGDTLQHMVDGAHDPHFDRLLQDPRFAWVWAGIVLSAGGNDLIDAARQRAVHADGRAAAPHERLLLTPAEAAARPPEVTGAARWVSEPGWALLDAYLRHNLGHVVQRRDNGPNRGRPLLLHTYSVPVVRPAGVALQAPQGWLWPAFDSYGIPGAERQRITTLLFERLRGLLLSLDCDAAGPQALPQVHVFDSARLVALEPADPASTGESGDWVNEIHPNRHGYARLGAAMGPWLEAALQRYR